jgi:prepilin-type N-terminal cleavage/methylation domain-containing protein
MRNRRSPSAGYSLVELIAVVAIIGVLSLITVPAFMNFQRQNAIRSAMRTVATDFLAARAKAIRDQFDVRVSLTPSTAENNAARTYSFFSSRDDGTTWTPMDLRIREGSQGLTSRTLEGRVWFESATNFQDLGSDGSIDIVFHPDGTVDLQNDTTVLGKLVLATDWAEIRSNRYNVWVRRSGVIRGLPSECSDGVDNDNDGKIDFGGAATNDTQCGSTADNDEAS